MAVVVKLIVREMHFMCKFYNPRFSSVSRLPKDRVRRRQYTLRTGLIKSDIAGKIFSFTSVEAYTSDQARSECCGKSIRPVAKALRNLSWPNSFLRKRMRL